jgi:hypothetical protein
MRFYGRRPGLVYLGVSLVLINSVALFQLGCGRIGFSSEAYNHEKTNSVNGKKPESKINSNLSPTLQLSGLEMFRYQMHLEWPEDQKSVSVFIDDQFAFHSNQSSNSHSYDVGLNHNSKYKVTLVSINSNGERGAILAEWTVQTPLDVLLSNEEIDRHFEDKQKIEIQANRVFVKARESVDSSFLTLGRDVLINTNEFISENGVISTFGKNTKAPSDVKGRNGGLLIIKAKKATGSLAFELRGENGGDGRDGEPYTQRANSGGNGADGLSEHWDSDRGSKSYCSRQPENGKPGTTGSKGRAGSNGKAGGNSGVLQLEVSDVSPEFHFTIQKEAGIAGINGKGGPGQLAGLGGQPGKSAFNCNNAKPGPEGKSGERGLDGVREKDGEIQRECISIGEGFGRCS